MYSVKNDAVPAEVDETQSHVDCKLNNKMCYNLTAVLYQDCESSAMCSVKIDAVFAEVDEKLSHMDPVVVLETLDLAL